MVLDLHQGEQVEILRQLISQSDVFIQNLKPGALAKLGVELDILHQQHSKLISISISGFAVDGPGHCASL